MVEDMHIYSFDDTALFDDILDSLMDIYEKHIATSEKGFIVLVFANYHDAVVESFYDIHVCPSMDIANNCLIDRKPCLSEFMVGYLVIKNEFLYIMRRDGHKGSVDISMKSPIKANDYISENTEFPRTIRSFALRIQENTKKTTIHIY
jgi:hypothetical protein